MADSSTWSGTNDNAGGGSWGVRKGTQKDQLNRYRTRLSVAKKWRKDEKYDDTWRRLIDMYRLRPFDDQNRLGMADDRIAVNVGFATINVIAPSVAINHPKITVRARQPDFDDQAVIAEAVVNYWWRHYNFQEELRLAVKDELVIGHGWLKVGWRYGEKEVLLEDGEKYAQVRQQIDEANQYAEQNPEQAGDLPTDADIEAAAPSTKMVPTVDCPTVERVSPFDVFVDPEAISIRDAKWIAQKLVRSLTEIKEDKNYSSAVANKLKADGSTNPRWRDDKSGSSSSKYNDEVARVTLWEFYDLQENTYCVFADTQESAGFLVKPQPCPLPYGHPFVMLANYQVPDAFYPIGDLEAIETLQQELNKTRSEMMNHRKKYARKYLIRASGFGEDGRAALQSERDNQIVPVIDEDRPFNDLIAPLPITPIDPQLYQWSDRIEGDIDRVTGVSEYARGQLPEIRRTATEASIIQDAANARAADKLAIVEKAIAECGRRLVQLAQKFVTGEQVVRVVGSMGQQIWVPFRREDVEGEFDFEVEAGSTQPINDSFRRQQALQLLNTMAPLVANGVVNGQELVRYTLQFGFGIKNPERFLLQQPAMPGAPGMPPGGPVPPGAPGQQPAPAPTSPSDVTPTQNTTGKDAINPQMLLQLQNQMGLELPNTGMADG